MRSIEDLYREFCERVAQECEAEARRYEDHPDLQDRDHQFIDALRDRAKNFRQQITRIDAAHSSRF